MPRFRPESAHQETPAADAYATNKRGSFPEVDSVAPRFRVSADNQVLVYAHRSYWLPVLCNALLAFCFVAYPGGLLDRPVFSLFFIVMFGPLSWRFYDHTVIVLNSAMDDAQYFNKTIRSTTRMRIPLSHLQAVRVEISSGGSGRRFCLNFGPRDMPSSHVFSSSNAASDDADVIREWLAFHNRSPEQ